MSFIYAEKCNDDVHNCESVRVFCDTKIILPENAAANFSQDEIDLISKYGIVKSTICCPEVCVSFAGEDIALAAGLFRKLYELKTFEPENVSDYALDIHKNAKNINDIEFIVTYFSNGETHIDCVKEGTVEKNLQNAHIGSTEAFARLQEIRLSSIADARTQTGRAFQDVVNGCSDDSVGGRAIEVIYSYDFNSFVYNWKRGFCSSKDQIVGLGEPLSLHSSASDGGYSYEVEQINIENVLFSIDQMEPAILYSRNRRIDSTYINNPNLFGLMMPMLVKRNDNGEIIRFR